MYSTCFPFVRKTSLQAHSSPRVLRTTATSNFNWHFTSPLARSLARSHNIHNSDQLKVSWNSQQITSEMSPFRTPRYILRPEPNDTELSRCQEHRGSSVTVVSTWRQVNQRIGMRLIDRCRDISLTETSRPAVRPTQLQCKALCRTTGTHLIFI